AHRRLSIRMANDGEVSVEPFAVVGGRHLAAWSHRARLHLAFAGPFPHEIAKPLVLGPGLGRLRRLRGGDHGVRGDGSDRCEQAHDLSSHLHLLLKSVRTVTLNRKLSSCPFSNRCEYQTWL